MVVFCIVKSGTVVVNTELIFKLYVIVVCMLRYVIYAAIPLTNGP